MANIYVRLPYYIASYLRNLDPGNPLKPGQPYIIEQSDELYVYLCEHIVPNTGNTVNKDCFAEKQWEAMRKGKYLLFREGVFMDMSRRYLDPLTISEIYLLSGNEDKVKRDMHTLELEPDAEYNDEYVPFLLPRSVIRDGREQKVYSDWFLPNISHLRAVLSSRFERSLINFIADFLASNNRKNVKATKQEAQDRFLLKYDIRPGALSRDRLKKEEQRFMRHQKAMYAQDVNADLDKIDSTPRLTATVNQKNAPKRVLCFTNGEIYPSLSAFARAIGVATSTVVSAAEHRAYRTHGHRFELIDDNAVS